MYLGVDAGVDYRRRVQRRPGRGTALEERNLQSTFVDKPLTVGFWTAFTYGRHTPLIPMRKRTEKERKSDSNKLGLDSKQYVHEILLRHLLPLYQACGDLEEGVETVEDGASYHKSDYTRRYRLQHGIKCMEWIPHSPNLNPLENVWSLWKKNYRRRV